MALPTRVQAHAMLANAAALNPGPWERHSLVTARVAEAIARAHPDLDPEDAYVMGALHDIGRREGITSMHHIIAGYRYLTALGYDEVARISLTHSFPVKNIHAAAGRWDATPEEQDEVRRYLIGIEYTPYDRLIQLCDALSLPSGPCLMEKRMVDVVRRYGFNDWTLGKWEAYDDLLSTFEAEVGGSIYALLPGVVENTFGHGFGV